METGNREFRFIRKTQKIIEQYNSFNLPPNENYDVTLLLNACVGLLFIAHEKHKNKLPNAKAKYKLELWGIHTENISICKNNHLKDEDITIKSVCKHIRNSIAHCNFETRNTNKKIDRIIFKDYSNRNGKRMLTFNMEISVNNFEIYAKALSTYILNKEDSLISK